MSTLHMDNILAEILPRLSFKFINRFKCVSKSFKLAISSQDFIQLYLRYQPPPSNPSDILILSGDGRIICYDFDSATTTATFVWDDREAFVLGSSNGLLCVSTRDSTRDFLLLNPFTRISKHVNIPRVGKQSVSNLGFALDYENLDYKIVVVTDHHDYSATKTRITMVYSLNTDSWKTMEKEYPTDSMEVRHGGVLIHQSLLHWMFWSPALRKRRIGCFDVCKMEWTDNVLLPCFYYNPDHGNYLLDFGVLADGLFSSFENQARCSYDVWVMQEYGVQNSWIKLLSIQISNDLRGGVVPVIYRRGSCEILIKHRHSSKLLWYNWINAGMTRAVFNGVPYFSSLQACTYSTTLIELPGAKLFQVRK